MPRRPARTLSMHNFRFARHFEGDHTESLSGQREPFPADDIAEPNYEVYAFSLCRRPRGRYGLVPILVGRTVHHLREPKDRKGIFVRSGYSVRLAYVDDPEDSEDEEFLSGCYARVLHIRRWLLLLPLLFATLLLSLLLSLCGSGSSPVAFLDGQTQISGTTSKPVLTTSYASYSATPDTTWRSGETRQDMTLLLPATCTVDGKLGANPVLSAPSIAVDLDKSGTFEPHEVLFNSEGAYLRAGSQLDHVDLSEPLAAGEYSARTVWRSVLLDGKTKAGAATFDWHLTVR